MKSLWPGMAHGIIWKKNLSYLWRRRGQGGIRRKHVVQLAECLHESGVKVRDQITVVPDVTHVLILCLGYVRLVENGEMNWGWHRWWQCAWTREVNVQLCHDKRLASKHKVESLAYAIELLERVLNVAIEVT